MELGLSWIPSDWRLGTEGLRYLKSKKETMVRILVILVQDNYLILSNTNIFTHLPICLLILPVTSSM